MRSATCLAVLLAACSASHDPEVGDFLRDYHALACASSPHCPASIVQSVGAYAIADPSVCNRLDADDATVIGEVSSGDATYDPVAAAACLAELRDGACAQALLTNWFANPGSCLRAIRRRGVALGGACGPYAACDGGLYCAPGCPATCQPETPVGSVCAAAIDCHGAEVCGADMRCAHVVPVEAHLGEPCGAARCVDADTVCVGVCARPVATGAACAETGVCPSTDLCVSATRVCTPMVVTGEVGSPCTRMFAGAPSSTPYCNDLAGLFCGDDDRCHTFTGAAGERCSGTNRCAAPLICAGSRCVAPSPDGAPCSAPWECTSGICNDGLCTSC